MAKQKVQFSCNECGGVSPRWQGQCPHCKAWNTLVEEIVVKEVASANRFAGITKSSGKVEKIKDVKIDENVRVSSGFKELDRVLGGGFVEGGVVLLGGEPGIGKSTILLQVLAEVSKTKTILYVSGEESNQQIAMRATRLGVNADEINLLCEIELSKVQSVILDLRPDFVVIDSIQTVFNSLLTSAPGSVSQVKECAAQLNRMAKENNITMIIIGHVTKDGDLAGPKILEHIVDTVLYFEGDKSFEYRLLRTFKNRFGTIDEVGVFAMTSLGLQEVNDPTGIFLAKRTNAIGSSLVLTLEGNRAFAIEVQALLDETPLPNPIRRSIGLDNNRVQMLCAILHKYLEIPIYTQNVFVTVIGGLKVSDTGIDLPLFLAMLSSYAKKELSKDIISFGEIGLTGDLRIVSNVESRVKEASRLGFKTILLPALSKKQSVTIGNNYGVKLVECNNVHDVIGFVRNN